MTLDSPPRANRLGLVVFYLEQPNLEGKNTLVEKIQQTPNALVLNDQFSSRNSNVLIGRHYRQVIDGLDLEHIEKEFTSWFAGVLRYLEEYTSQDNHLLFKGINLFAAESLTLYLKLYQSYEKFICARKIIDQFNPSAIYLVSQRPGEPASIFGSALELCCRNDGIPIEYLQDTSSLPPPTSDKPIRLKERLSAEIGMLIASLQKPWRSPRKSKEIWCIEENPNNLGFYEPLRTEFSGNSQSLSISTLSLHYSIKLAADKGSLSAPTPYDQISLGAVFSFARRLRDFVRGADALLTSPEFRALFVWDGVNAWPLFARQARSLLIKDNVKIIWYLVLIDRLFTRHAPAAVITTYGLSHYRRAVLELARRHELPTLILQNAAIPRQLLWSLLPDHPVLVWGEATRQFLISQGARADLLSVVGPMKYESITRSNEATSLEAEKHHLQTGKPVILFTANFTGAWGQYYDWELVDMMVNLASRHPDYQWLLTLHPRTPPAIVEGVKTFISEHLYPVAQPESSVQADTQSLPVKVLLDYDIWALYRLAQVVVTVFSTTGIDASVSGTPVINVLTHNRPDWLGLSDCGASIIVRDELDLELSIENLLSEPELRTSIQEGQRRYFDAYLDGLDGKAASRAATYLRNLVE